MAMSFVGIELDLDRVLQELISVGAQTALAPIALGASIPSIVQALETCRTQEDIQDFADTMIFPCLRHLSSITHSHLLDLYTGLQETATSRAIQMEQCSHLISGLQSRVRACRSGLHVLYCQRSLS